MFEIAGLVTFVVVVLALFLVPGPAVMLTLARSIGGGWRVGLATGLGIAVGDMVHTVMSALGLSALLMTSALAFEVVKYAGAAYLVYLGIRAFLEKVEGADVPAVPRVDARRAFRQAVLTEVLNPKTALFFLAFLPQFVDPARGSLVVQLLVLGLIFVALSLAYTALLAVAAGSVGGWLARNRRIARWQGRATGSIYIGLGVHLALQQRQ